jgi:CYTH domain-containing protein
MLELEKTFLVKKIPELAGCSCKEIFDIYIPVSGHQSRLRIRKNGNTYEITKKYPVKSGDASKQIEETVSLTEEEFGVLLKIDGKKIRKMRYMYEFDGRMCELDVFLDELKGLVLVDFEFENLQEMKKFKMPAFCLADVTQENFVSGGRLCGKKYADIEGELKRFGYNCDLVF